MVLIDAHAGPAQSASALPVGMLSPHVTRSPTPLSRLTTLGVPLARHELEAGVPAGNGWTACEVDNLGADAGRWPATLVRPAALVEAWLREAAEQTAMVCHWNCKVGAIRKADKESGSTTWEVLDPHGKTIDRAPVIVVAAALGSLDLLAGAQEGDGATHFPLRPVKGQLSLAALDAEPLSPRPQRNQGVFVPCYEDTGLAPHWPSRIWAMGSTYERGTDDRVLTSTAHSRNAASLSMLSPSAAREFQSAQAQGRLLGWAEVRCASLDRLPLVGALPDLQAWQRLAATAPSKARPPSLASVPRLKGLFTLCALGSRGLSLASLCGQILARQIEGEPDELPAELRDAMDPARFAWRQARRRRGSSDGPAQRKPNQWDSS